MADCDRSAIGIAARELGFALAGSENSFDVDSILGLLTELGFTFPPELVGDTNFVNAIQDAVVAASLLPELADAVSDSFDEDLVTILTAISNLLDQVVIIVQAFDTTATAIDTLASTLPGVDPASVSAFAGELTDRLLDYLVITYMEAEYPRLLAFLKLLGVAEVKAERVGSTDPSQPPYFRRRLRLDRIPGLFSDPEQFMRDEYRWGEADFDGELLLSRLSGLLTAFVVPHDFRPAQDANPPSLRVLLFSMRSRLDIEPKGYEANLAFTLQEPFVLQFPFVIEDWFIEVGAEGALDEGLSATIQPQGTMRLVPPTGVLDGALTVSVVGIRPPAKPPFAVLALPPLGCVLARRVSAGVGVQYSWDTGEGAAVGDPIVELKLEDGEFHINPEGSDGFISSILPSGGVSLIFDFGIGWSQSKGVFLTGAAGLNALLPIHRSIGPFTIDFVRLRLKLEGSDASLLTGIIGAVQLGPVTVTVDSIAFETLLQLEQGNLGPINVDGPTLVPPNGLGILVDAGAVRGGGFLYFDFDQGRYSGAIELSVFSISVKAFGLVDTKLPDGSPGFSFVIVISAEFTPIQLGFGFTLLGVGGMLGVNRTVNAEALGVATRTGSLAHLLFPRNPVRDAPAIVHDLATVFPAAQGHYIFAPMAKFGWGTPTLITGSFGILMEFPGPRLGLLGVVRMQLPDPDAAVLSLQMAMSGLLDFPAKTLSVDAGLFDSVVAGYPVWGDMAYRLGFGSNAKFLMSVGGFNPDFDAPAGFPELRRASVELGVNGNPSLVASGYFALTSNTAQIGARLDLVAKGGSVRLTGWFGVDALFVFSPFSFTAGFSAGMRVSFHGHGIGVTLRGTLSGPNPWMVTGKVCVSVLFWDACLSVDHTFGNNRAAALPEIDPWDGFSSEDPRLQVVGLAEAVADPRNWSGSSPPAGFGVVSLSEATASTTPIDPLGAATLRQKVVPLQTVITKFGEYKPVDHDQFFLTSVLVNTQPVDLTTTRFEEDDFAPAHFNELSNAEKLSADSYQPMVAGFTIAPDRTTIGSSGTRTVEYETDFINDEGQLVHDDVVYSPSQALLAGLLKRSAVALGGIRQAGARKYSSVGKPKRVSLGPKRFVVVNRCSSLRTQDILGTEVSQIQAFTTLREHVASHPEDQGRYQVAPRFAAL